MRPSLMDSLEQADPDLVPVDRPFTSAEAAERGLSRRQLDVWIARQELVRPFRGIYHARTLRDDLGLRLSVLRLVVPEDCVVTDRTAAWLWGAPMVLAPGDHQRTPAVSVFAPPGRRLRNGLAASGERRLRRTDVIDVEGLQVTSPLRTACDMGRLLHRDQALAGMDSLASLGSFSVAELVAETARFPGYRGVVQLRVLAPLVDPAAGSPGESALRLRWYDAGLPRPQCQVPVSRPGGSTYYIDLGLEGARFGAEYDGEAFHGPEHQAHDAARRLWLEEGADWHLVVARRDNVYGPHQDADRLLQAAAARWLWTR